MPAKEVKNKKQHEAIKKTSSVDKKDETKKKTLSAKEVIELAGNDETAFDAEPEELIEPDSTLLIQQEEDLEDISIRDHSLAAELAEDPVRLYLREIGLVKLLNADSEFRLATIIEANRLVTTLSKLKQRRGYSIEG